jgi:hypothetical protein
MITLANPPVYFGSGSFWRDSGAALAHRRPCASRAFSQHPLRRMGPCARGDNEKCSRGMICPSFPISLSLLEEEGAGNAGCTLHPWSRVPRTRAFGAHEHTGERKHSDIPCAMALRLTSCSPRWSGLVFTVTSRKLPARLSASIAAPGPHDLAVRLGVFVRRAHTRLTPKRPSHQAPNAS